MLVDFNVLESETIRRVMLALGEDELFFWPLRGAHLSQQEALCTIGQLLTMRTEHRNGMEYLHPARMLCPRVGRPSFDGRHVCAEHDAHHQPCTTCGRYAAAFVGEETRCYRCQAIDVRRPFLVGEVPQRFQWRRIKGARTPVHALDVTRRSCWGNPFTIVHQRTLLPKHYRQQYRNPQLADVAVRLFEASYARNTTFRRDVHHCLAGRDLKCFCPLDWPCHADVLLRWANDED